MKLSKLELHQLKQAVRDKRDDCSYEPNPWTKLYYKICKELEPS